MKIVPFHQIDAKFWNQFVEESPEAWLYHRTEWMELEEMQGGQNESFMIQSDTGEPLEIFCVYLSPQGPWWRLRERYFHTGHCRGGPAMASRLIPEQRKEVTVLALNYLAQRAQRCGANRLEVRLPSLAPAYLPPLRSGVSPLWEYGFRTFPMYGKIGIGRLKGSITPNTIVELHGRDEESLFNGISPSGRRAVRKAIRAGVECAEIERSKGLEGFYATYASSHLRSGSSRKSFTFFQKMSESFGKIGEMKIFLANHDKKPIASTLLLSYKEAVTYYAGGVDYEEQLLRPHSLLFWETIKWARGQGARWYEMGPYFPYLPKENKMSRIGQFKRQFGGMESPLFEGVYFYNWSKYAGGALLEETWFRIYAWLSRVRCFCKREGR